MSVARAHITLLFLAGWGRVAEWKSPLVRGGLSLWMAAFPAIASTENPPNLGFGLDSHPLGGFPHEHLSVLSDVA
jgi:hypothetical protein